MIFHDETKAAIERAAFRIECQILADMLDRPERSEKEIKQDQRFRFRLEV